MKSTKLSKLRDDPVRALERRVHLVVELVRVVEESVDRSLGIQEAFGQPLGILQVGGHFLQVLRDFVQIRRKVADDPACFHGNVRHVVRDDGDLVQQRVDFRAHVVHGAIHFSGGRGQVVHHGAHGAALPASASSTEVATRLISPTVRRVSSSSGLSLAMTEPITSSPLGISTSFCSTSRRPSSLSSAGMKEPSGCGGNWLLPGVELGATLPGRWSWTSAPGPSWASLCRSTCPARRSARRPRSAR